MPASELAIAAQLLRDYFGRQPLVGQPGRWSTLVKVVLPAPRSPAGSDSVSAVAEGRIFRSPGETAAAGVDEIVGALSGIPRAKQKGPVLKILATWWLERFGDQPNAVWEGDCERYRNELSRMRGVGSELADRLLLVVGKFTVYPLNRSSIRVACRHGWIGFEAEYDEWQSLFAATLAQDDVDLSEFSQWMALVGRDFCGVRAKCEDCPLRSPLPDGGPYEPDAF